MFLFGIIDADAHIHAYTLYGLYEVRRMSTSERLSHYSCLI